MCTGIPESVAAVDSAAAIFSTYQGVEAASAAWTLADLGFYSQLASTGLSVVGMVDQGITDAETADINAKNSKAVAARNAQIIKNQAARDERIALEKFNREQAKRRTWFGATGGGGESSAEVLAGAASAYEMDALTRQYNTDLEVQNVLYGGDADAAMYRMKSSSALYSLPFTAGSTLLSGGARAIKYRLSKN